MRSICIAGFFYYHKRSREFAARTNYCMVIPQHHWPDMLDLAATCFFVAGFLALTVSGHVLLVLDVRALAPVVAEGVDRRYRSLAALPPLVTATDPTLFVRYGT